MMNSRDIVDSILRKLNAESAQIIRSFLLNSITEEEFRKQALALQQKYYDALVKEKVITPSEEAHRQIVEEGKAIPISIEAVLACKRGEITRRDICVIYAKRVLPLARQEAENVH
jgi:hypothetical protein